MKIITSTPLTVQSMAKEALNAKLYIPGYSLVKLLTKLIESDSKEPHKTIHYTRSKVKHTRLRTVIALAYSDTDEPVGIAMVSFLYLNVYVKPEHRRNKVGTRLVSSIVEIPGFNDKLWYCGSAKRSKAFFESIKNDHAWQDRSH